MADQPTDEQPHPATTDTPLRAKVSRILPLAVFAVVLAASGTLALGTHDLLGRQQDSLLKERTNEVRTILLTSINDTATILSGAGAAAVSNGPTNLFSTLAAGATANGGEVVVARLRGDALVTVARAGEGNARVGADLPADVAALARRAVSAKGMVSGIVSDADGRRVVLALKAPGAPGTVSFLSSPLAPPTAAPTDPDSPYRELNVAVYASRTRDATSAVLTSGDTPGPGAVVRDLPIGAEQWVLAVSPRPGLVSSLARAFPWVVLGTGLALGLALAFLTGALTRRRAYALRLVEERTRALREAEAAATRANHAKSEFLSRMSHELRTPLNAILGFAQLLQIDDLTPDQAENVDQIAKGGSHLVDLINEILDISRIETGTMAMSPEAVRVAQVVDAAVALLRPLAEDRDVHLVADLDALSGVHVLADRQRLLQILLNLIGNAIKYNRQGGSVWVGGAVRADDRIRVLVTDTGPGIAPEQAHLLFAPFERLGAELTSVPGTGVGLALSRGLAEAMDGSVDMDSTPGRGSTFWVELPSSADPLADVDNPTPDDPTLHPAADGTDRVLVLHIEDNETNIRLVERVLARRPEVSVVPALQGRVGLDLARRHHPAMILLDLNLLDLPGTEVLRELKADPGTADIPVVVISADATAGQADRLEALGALTYLTKPVDIQQLLATVEACTAPATGGAR